jgi:hypothetical protein
MTENYGRAENLIYRPKVKQGYSPGSVAFYEI